MFVQFVTINVKPGFTDQFEKAFRINFEGTRKEPGNLRFDVLRNQDEPNRYTIYEVFRDKDAFQAHKQTDHYAECVRLIDPIIVLPRPKQYLDAVMIDLEGTGP